MFSHFLCSAFFSLLLAIALPVWANPEFIEAIKNDDTPKVEQMIDAGGINPNESYVVDIDVDNRLMANPLNLAAAYGSLNVIRLLTGKYKMSPDEYNHGRLPLHIAALFGQMAVVDMMLKEYSVSLYRITERGAGQEFALHSAAAGGYLQIVKYLLELDSGMLDYSSACDDPLHGCTPLQSAYRNSTKAGYEVFEYLLLKGANPNVDEHNGNTLFHDACKNGKFAIVKLLLESPNLDRSVINTANRDGKMPIQLAANYPKIVDLLTKSGAIAVETVGTPTTVTAASIAGAITGLTGVFTGQVSPN